MSGIETAALVASIVSVILAGVAIWLSFQFYRLTTQQSEKVEAAAAGIQSSVVKLDEVFQLLYRDAFAEVKANAEWHRNNQPVGSNVDAAEMEQRIQAKADEAAAEVSGKLAEQLADMLEKQKGQTSDLQQLEGRIGSMAKEAIESIRAADASARSHGAEKRLMDAIAEYSKPPNGKMVTLETLMALTGLSHEAIQKHLRKLLEDGDILTMPWSIPNSAWRESGRLGPPPPGRPTSPDPSHLVSSSLFLINPSRPYRGGETHNQTKPSGDP